MCTIENQRRDEANNDVWYEGEEGICKCGYAEVCKRERNKLFINLPICHGCTADWNESLHYVAKQSHCGRFKGGSNV